MEDGVCGLSHTSVSTFGTFGTSARRHVGIRTERKRARQRRQKESSAPQHSPDTVLRANKVACPQQLRRERRLCLVDFVGSNPEFVGG